MTIIYRSWDAYDAANSDSFFPTLAAAQADIRDNYGIKGPIKLDAKGEWVGKAGDDCGSASRMEVYLQRVDIDTSREGLCLALKTVPHR